MKLVTFEIDTVLGCEQRLGAWVQPNGQDAKILDLNTAMRWYLAECGEPNPTPLANILIPPCMLGLIQREHRGMADALDTLEAIQSQWPAQGPQGAQLYFLPDTVTLKCPLPRPTSFRDFISFETHVKASAARRQMEVPEAWYQYPIYYKGNHQAFIGSDEPVFWPSYTQKLDFELELACIVGKIGTNIAVEDASEYIFGYAVLNDWSARDRQMAEMQCRMGPAKGKDFANAMGPMIVTADEVSDPRNLKMTARVNGETWCEGNSGWSHWTFEQMIASVSQDETLYAGDVLGSGTVDNGCGLDLGRWVQPGDVVELEIEGLGILKNTIQRPDANAS